MLLVINTNWHPIAHRFKVIADYCANFGQKRSLCVFSRLWRLRSNVHCSSSAQWKAHSVLPISDNWSFLL